MPDRTQPPRRIDMPKPCFVKMKYNGAWHGARIYRALGMLRGEINGQPAEPERIWTSGDLISELEYHALIAVANSPKPF